MIDPRFEPLLRAVLTGELDRSDAQVVEAARQDPAFARELAAHLAVVDSLERDAVLADAARTPDDPASERVAPFLRARLARRTWMRRTVVVAAAALLAYVLIPRGGDPASPSPPDDFPLTGLHLECVEPSGETQDVTRFRWESDVEGGFFEISVFDSAGQPLPPTPVHLGDVREWIPDPKQVAAWPRSFEWQIEWIDEDDVKRLIDSAQVRKLP